MNLSLVLLSLFATQAAARVWNESIAEAMKKFEEGLKHRETEAKIRDDPNYDLFAGRRRVAGLGEGTGEGGVELSKPLLADTFGGNPGFYHSVASGDPLPEAVIIWTRYTPLNVDDVILLDFRIAEVDAMLYPNELLDPMRNSNLKRGTVEVDYKNDWVAKLDITGLKSNTQYLFAFTDGKVASDVGLTRTAPAPDEDVKELHYAVFSCSNFPNGYFHAYDIASTIENLDVWFHVRNVLI